jgi:hypothetical protein
LIGKRLATKKTLNEVEELKRFGGKQKGGLLTGRRRHLEPAKNDCFLKSHAQSPAHICLLGASSSALV